MVKVVQSLSEIPVKGKVVLDCFATWCGPCKRIAPVFEKMAGEFPYILFLKADTDFASDIADTFQVNALPTFVFIKDGRVVDRVEGADMAGIVAAADKLNKMD